MRAPRWWPFAWASTVRRLKSRVLAWEGCMTTFAGNRAVIEFGGDEHPDEEWVWTVTDAKLTCDDSEAGE